MAHEVVLGEIPAGLADVDLHLNEIKNKKKKTMTYENKQGG